MTTLEMVKGRIYLVGLPFAAKDEAKFVLGMDGSNWDIGRKQWWVGKAKHQQAIEYVARLNAGASVATPLSAAAAAEVGLDMMTPAAIVADKLEEEGKDTAAQAIRASETFEQIDAMRAYSKVNYNGRTYYVVAQYKEDGFVKRFRITTLDRMAPLWVDRNDCTIEKHYEGKTVWSGARFRSTKRVTYPTIGSLRAFREQQQKGEREGLPVCAHCGKRSQNLVEDLEDGLMKCWGCCDIPSGGV